MEPFMMLIMMSLIGGLIGYLTNKVAVKMLFRPYRVLNFGLFKIQGVLPKRQADIAKSVGETIETSLLNDDDLFESLFSPEAKSALKQEIGDTISQKIYRFIPSMFRSMFGGELNTMIDQFIEKEGDALIDAMVEKIKESANDHLHISQIVESRINALDLNELEQLVRDLTKRELRHIETIGLILGLIIGFIQFFVVSMF